MRRADGRLLLKVVGRQKMLIRSGELLIKAPGFGDTAVQQIPIPKGKRRLPRGRKSQRRGAGRGHEPHETRCLSRRLGCKGHQQYAEHHTGKHRAHMLGKRGGGTQLGESRPLQKPLMAHSHAPECREHRREAYPRLKGQQPQPHEAAHDRAAEACQQSRVPPQPDSAVLTPKPCIGQRQDQILPQGQERRPARKRETGAFKAQSKQHRREGHRRHETAPQAFQQAEAIHQRQLPLEDPGCVLPVTAYPAVQALKVGKRL